MSEIDKKEENAKLSRYFKAKLLDAFDAMAPSTAKAYQRDFVAWIKTLNNRVDSFEEAVKFARDMDYDDACAALRAFRDRTDISPNTKARYVRSVRSMCKKLADCGILSYTLESVKAPRVAALKDTAGPKPDQVQRLLDHVKSQFSRDAFAVRDYAIIATLHDGALRRSELASARVVDLERGDPPTLHVKGKGRHEREPALISKRALNALDHYLNTRTNDSEWLICGYGRTDAMHPFHIQRILQKRCEEAGVKVIAPHQLRHAAITKAATNWKGDMFGLVRFARHKDPKTTKIYVDNASDRATQIAEIVSANVNELAKEIEKEEDGFDDDVSKF